MKKITVLLISLILVFALVGCGTTNETQTDNKELITLKVGATSVPHAEILREIKDDLKAEGIDLEIVEYEDFVQPNIHLSEGEIDANYFQHVPYFESFTKERNINNLVNVAKIHIEPMGIYSSKIKSLDELEQGAKVSVPNDPSNMGRALALLEKAELIKLKEGVGVKGTVQDVVDNPKNLEIIPLNAPTLPRTLEDVVISVINTNFAIKANLNPLKDSLFIEDANSPYANVLTVRIDDKDSESIQKLVKALTSDKVKKFIEDKYQGAIIPVF